jgi:hypothetical protein
VAGTAPCSISREPRIAVEPLALASKGSDLVGSTFDLGVEHAYFGPFVSHRLRYLGFAALIVFRPAPKTAY